MAEQTQSAQQVFESASRLLNEGKFAEAAENFEAIEKTGFTSSAMEAGWGRALTEKGELGQGIRHLTNALALDRFESNYRDDLSFAQSKVEGRLGTRMSHPVEWGNRLSTWMRPSESLYLCSSLILIALFYSLFALKKNTRLLVLLFVTAFLSVACAGFARYGRSVAVVVEISELRNAPLGSAEEIQKLPSGTRLRVVRKSGEFAEVERPGSFRGWVSQHALSPSPY